MGPKGASIVLLLKIPTALVEECNWWESKTSMLLLIAVQLHKRRVV